MDEEAMTTRAQNLLQLVGLGNRSDHQPSQLSGGERQRVAIARALANNPELVVADEPTANLDQSTAEAFMDLVRYLNRSLDKTFIVASHDPHVIQGCDTVYTMDHGKIRPSHSPALAPWLLVRKPLQRPHPPSHRWQI
jgi:ABC-type lipoprotein export system ATPase subunit